MPEEVFESIIYNLVIIAVHQVKANSEDTSLNIDITDNSLRFKNLIASAGVKTPIR
jgi:hypothetical protein